ncbi:MAG: PD-(D/E)XK nuclease family protein [Cytophagaceae bacterium]|jgi:hypothetical protein|nr:PD-(D/E)XK nuclease family protein [Cytophagaceae bacterium]
MENGELKMRNGEWRMENDFSLSTLHPQHSTSHFLDSLADFYVRNHSDNISNICFVFPGRRAGVFFKNKIKERFNRPVWTPRIITISDLFAELSGMQPCDNIRQLFTLYKVYRRVMGTNTGIDEFLPFGETILNDFNDIDKYRIDVRMLFANLSDYKAIEEDYSFLSPEQVAAIRSFWQTFNPDKLSAHQQEFLAIWNRMYLLYETFRNELRQKNEAYEGMIYRHVADRIKMERYIETPYQHIVFAGFNALNSCERLLFNWLNMQKKASFFWDYPEWLLTTQAGSLHHESIVFVQQNLFDFPSPKGWQMPSNSKLPAITIASAPNDLTMSQIAGKFLSENLPANSTEAEKTAVILADENLLFPVLHAIPKEIESINVTIGYPVKNTPAFTLVECLLALQKTMRVTKEGKTWFYHQPLIALLRHQYINILLEGEQGSIIKKIIQSNTVFIEKGFLENEILLNNILIKINDTVQLTSYLNDILLQLHQKLAAGNGYGVEKEFVRYMITVLNRLSDILSQYALQPAPDTWLQLFRRLVEQLSIPFEGEPLSGLQIMGILETRALDFDNLIVLGMNEGILPRTSLPDTFIPFNLRRGYNLPVIDNQDSIYANYFYRLINRAKQVHLVYCTTKTVTGEGEMSRFLQQIYYEYPANVKMETVIQKVSPPRSRLLFAAKSAEVIAKMEKWRTAVSPLSPSALSVYIDCPLQFYFKHVAGIREADEISEDLNPRIFGNLFHRLVEILYQPMVGTNVTASALEALLKNENNLKESLTQVFIDTVPFVKHSSSTFIDLQGKNSLVYEVLLKYIKQFLKLEMQVAPFILAGLEKKVSKPFPLPSGKTIYIGGVIDRVDIRGNTLRIIDYKTGKTGHYIKSVDELFDTVKHSDVKVIFQTLVYSYIQSLEYPDREIAPGVISVRKLFSDTYSTDILFKPARTQGETITFSLVRQEFMHRFAALLNEIFNPDVPFNQTENKKNCKYCLFIEHCRRGE